jgi:hypothetical protein
MINAILKEAKRLWIFIAIAACMMFTDIAAAKYIMFGLGCISSVLVFAHLVRKLLHPYVDLHRLYERASDEPLSSAITLVAFIYLVTTVLNVAVQFIK